MKRIFFNPFSKLIRFFLFLIVLNSIFSFKTIHAQSKTSHTTLLKAFQFENVDLHSYWVNKKLHRLSRRKRIAQIFMVAAYSNQTKQFSDSVARIIKRFQPGGIIFFQGGPYRQALLENQYQHFLKVPAFIAQDAEWGLAMRLDSTQIFPYQMTLGAIDSPIYLRKMGVALGNQLKSEGVQINFAPVIDINNNIHNTVINFRSFGENKNEVSEKGIAYMLGLQDAGILATGKHFPGHGDTEVDSHKDLPVLPFSKVRLDSLELFPFKKVISKGIGAIMVAHMNIPSLDTIAHLPSSLSLEVIQKLLINTLGFKGLVFTDAMNMKGVLKYFPAGNAEFRALQAGTDVIEMSTDLKKSLKIIRKAIRKHIISREMINEKCRKILAFKEQLGLANYKPVDLVNLYEDLHKKEDEDLIQNLSDKALTLVKDSLIQGQNFKERNLNNPIKKGIILSINPPLFNSLDSDLSRMYHLPLITIKRDIDSLSIDSLKLNLGRSDYCIMLLHDKRLRPSASFNYSKALIHFISELPSYKECAVSILANPYGLAQCKGVAKASLILISYQDAPFTEKSMLKYWSNQLKPKGHLPVSIPGVISAGFKN